GGRWFAYLLRAVVRVQGVKGMPILAPDFGGMHGAVGAIAAPQCIHRAMAIAPPTDPFGMRGIQWEFLGHDNTPGHSCQTILDAVFFIRLDSDQAGAAQRV